jgi:ABC-type uncharacterized transport system permease subunit
MERAMSWLFDGIPLHPLFVHAAVIAIPVVALLAIAVAWFARVRDWLGIVFPIVASLGFVAALITKLSGEALETQVEETAAVAAHTGIADLAVAAAFLLLLVSWAQWVWDHQFVAVRPGRAEARISNPRTAHRVAVTISVVETVIAVFAIVAVIIVGDSGARAVWQ